MPLSYRHIVAEEGDNAELGEGANEADALLALMLLDWRQSAAVSANHTPEASARSERKSSD